MVFFFEFPIILILILIFGILGINIIPIITWIATICFILFFIIGGILLICGSVNTALLLLLISGANIAVACFLDGKSLYLWDIFAWLF